VGAMTLENLRLVGQVSIFVPLGTTGGKGGIISSKKPIKMRDSCINLSIYYKKDILSMSTSKNYKILSNSGTLLKF